MERFEEFGSLKRQVAAWQKDRPVALVPTMGALHQGHLSLVHAAQKRGMAVVVSIFVNPAQFGPQEDFARYPRTLEADEALLRAGGVEAVYVPSVAVMYPQGFATKVSVAGRFGRFVRRGAAGAF